MKQYNYTIGTALAGTKIIMLGTSIKNIISLLSFVIWQRIETKILFKDTQMSM